MPEKADREQFPRGLVWTMVALCALPMVLIACGVKTTPEKPVHQLMGTEEEFVRSVWVYSTFEWTAFTVALFTAIVALVHYIIHEDIVTPVIGVALLFGGFLDAFHILAVNQVISRPSFLDNFIPFTWALSRTFHAAIIILGIWPFLRGRKQRRSQLGGLALRYLLLAVVLCAITAWCVVFITTSIDQLPQGTYPGNVIPRPWDTMPLVLYLIAGGIVLPRFNRTHRSLFAYGLLLSLVPHIAAQLHAALGSFSLFDSHFYAASFLKIIAYAIPLTGLLLDYARSSRAQASLAVAENKLHVSRSVHDELLPSTAPEISGFDIAGYSAPAGALGGDYYDYIDFPDGKTGVIVGDVSGHEIASSILLAQTRAWVRAEAKTQTDPQQLLTDLNTFVSAHCRGNQFVCVQLAVVKPGAAEVALLTAGHEAAVIRSSGESEIVSTNCPPIGMMDDVAIPEPLSVSLACGDALLLLTDGITEASGPTGEQFGMPRVLQSLAGRLESRAEEAITGLCEDSEIFANYSPQVDDITAVVIKRSGEGES